MRRPKNNVIKENVSCVLQKSPQGQKFSLPSAAGQEIDCVTQYNSGCAVFKYRPTMVCTVEISVKSKKFIIAKFFYILQIPSYVINELSTKMVSPKASTLGHTSIFSKNGPKHLKVLKEPSGCAIKIWSELFKPPSQKN